MMIFMGFVAVESAIEAARGGASQGALDLESKKDED